ncbi:MAG: putative membrane protein insertion efficiency factor [Planctomycetota bacterium]|jgi:putative membrane protein insertion efficiency factor
MSPPVEDPTLHDLPLQDLPLQDSLQEGPAMQRVLLAAIGGLTEAFSAGTRTLLLLPIRFYRVFLSRLKPVQTCRFSPTCSAYAEEALRTHGVLHASGLIAWRLLRCQPFAKAGYDPVPPPSGSSSTHRH